MTSPYPMTVRKVRMSHSGGTKAYHFVLITTDGGPGMLLKRWGKVGVWGQMAFEHFHKSVDAAAAFRRQARERLTPRKGYAIEEDRSSAAKDQSELKRALGLQYWAKMGVANLEFLDPEIEAVGSREHRNPEVQFDDDGNIISYEMKQKFDIKDISEPETSPEEYMQRNENWGMF